MVRAEYVLHVCVKATRMRMFVDHVMIGKSDREHDQHANQDADDASNWAGFQQIGATRNNERAPSDAGTYRQSECGKNGNRFDGRFGRGVCVLGVFVLNNCTAILPG